jgi:FkbM family methyltransferase
VGRFRGVGVVAQGLHRRYLSSDAEWTVGLDGYPMILPVASSQTWTAAVTGRYSEDAISTVKPYLRPGSVIVDVGASLGLFAIPAGLAAQRVGGNLVAFEPVPSNVRYIRRNVTLNGLDGVVDVRPVGLANRSGLLEMRVEGAGAGNAAVVSGLSQDVVTHMQQGGLRGFVRAPVSRLDDEELPSCSVIKIDVEGLELEVLAGAAELIHRDRPVI